MLSVDAPRGFEPRLTESESVVLPLDDGAIGGRPKGRISAGQDPYPVDRATGFPSHVRRTRGPLGDSAAERKGQNRAAGLTLVPCSFSCVAWERESSNRYRISCGTGWASIWSVGAGIRPRSPGRQCEITSPGRAGAIIWTGRPSISAARSAGAGQIVWGRGSARALPRANDRLHHAHVDLAIDPT